MSTEAAPLDRLLSCVGRVHAAQRSAERRLLATGTRLLEHRAAVGEDGEVNVLPVQLLLVIGTRLLQNGAVVEEDGEVTALPLQLLAEVRWAVQAPLLDVPGTHAHEPVDGRGSTR